MRTNTIEFDWMHTSSVLSHDNLMLEPMRCLSLAWRASSHSQWMGPDYRGTMSIWSILQESLATVSYV